MTDNKKKGVDLSTLAIEPLMLKSDAKISADTKSLLTKMQDGLASPRFKIDRNDHSYVTDRRTRSEIASDYAAELKRINKRYLVELLNDLSKYPETDDGISNFYNRKNDIKKSINKFIDYIDKFEELNSETSKKIELKEKELRLEARSDWGSKFRLFLFRILASALFVFTLFLIGYLEKNYDWAVLPMSKYINTEIPSGSK